MNLEYNWRIKIDPQMADQEIVIQCKYEDDAQKIYQYLSQMNTGALRRWPIKGENGVEIIEVNKIIYLEVSEGLLTIQTTDNNYTIRMTMKDALSQLARPNFIQISKYSTLNIDYLERLELAFSGSMYAHLKNGQVVTISRRFVAQLKEYLGI